jgi:peptide/nickel transport system substrate-binding protein
MVCLAAACVLALSASVTVHPGFASSSEGRSPQPNSQFSLALGSEPQGLDPSQASDSNTFLVAGQIYETLVTYQPGSTLVVAGLAEAWSVSPDGLTWTFTLRSGVEFHDGTSLDAAAVLHNFERWWDPDHPYHAGHSYFRWLFGGYRGDPDCIVTELGSTGADRFHVTLSEPDGTVPSTMAMPVFSIASPAAIRSETLEKVPVGTGPFSFVQWTPGDSIALQRNTSYWGNPARSETLVFSIITEDTDRYAALQSDAVQGMAAAPLSFASSAGLDPGLKSAWRPASQTGFLGINRNHAPLHNPLVQKAIAHAVDKRSIIADHYNTEADAGLVADQLLPPGFWGRDQQMADYSYDPALARTLLTQAGHSTGISTTLWVLPVQRAYLPDAPDMAVSIQADLQAVGISATIVTYDWGTYLSKLAAGEPDLFMLGWSADTGHPFLFFHGLLCGGFHRAFGPYDDDLCSHLESARGELDFAAQVPLYEWASRHIHDTLPLIPIGYVRVPTILRHDVSGYPRAVVGAESLRDVFFSSSTIYLPLAASQAVQ